MQHIAVLKNEIIHTFSYLKDAGGYFVDGTLGNAGHSISIIQNSNLKSQNDNAKFKIIGIDKDEEALEIAKQNVEGNGLDDRFILINDDFKNIDNILSELKVNCIQGALLDLGVSSMQLDNKERGFSFQQPEAELDMRMDRKQTFSAKNVVNGYPKKDLEKILLDYGEEKFAKKITENIVGNRKNNPIRTTGDLVSIIERSIPEKFKHQKIHFATRTFQAIRIEVNKELEGLAFAIKRFVDFLAPGAKLAVISFHSLEDKIVKQTLNELADPCQCPSDMPCICGKKPIINIETKKPVIASEGEVRENSRARSAKLRIAVKLEIER